MSRRPPEPATGRPSTTSPPPRDQPASVAGWASLVRDRDPATFRDHVLGRVAWAASVDPVLGARLRDLAARIDWDAPGPAATGR